MAFVCEAVEQAAAPLLSSHPRVLCPSLCICPSIRLLMCLCVCVYLCKQKTNENDDVPGPNSTVFYVHAVLHKTVKFGEKPPVGSPTVNTRS